MISCKMVGKDSLVMIKVSPILNTNGLHEAKNTLSSCLKREPFGRTGILEKSREDSNTLEVNLQHCFKTMKVIIPTERATNTSNFPSVEVFRRIAT